MRCPRQNVRIVLIDLEMGKNRNFDHTVLGDRLRHI